MFQSVAERRAGHGGIIAQARPLLYHRNLQCHNEIRASNLRCDRGCISMTLAAGFFLAVRFYLSRSRHRCRHNRPTPELPADVGQLLSLTNRDRADARAWTAALESRTGGCGSAARGAYGAGITISSTNFPVSRMCRHAQAGRARTSARSRRTSRSVRTRRISRGSGCTRAMHRTNILDPQMNVIGIALIHNRGEVWAVEDFAHAVERPGAIGNRRTGDRPAGAAGYGATRGLPRMRGRPARCRMGVRADRARGSSCAGRAQT